MGLFDLFASREVKEQNTLRRMVKKVTEKYGPPENRQKAIEQLGQMGTPAALAALCQRFTVRAEPGITDDEEKEAALRILVEAGQPARAPVQEFVRREESGVAWGLRALAGISPAEHLTAFALAELARLSREYTRDPEKKLVLLHEAESLEDPRVAPTALPFLDDMADDVKIAGLRALAPRGYPDAREPMLRLLTAPETARRVQTAAIEAIARSAFGVQGYREKVESLLPEPFFVDKAGILKRRGAPAAGESE